MREAPANVIIAANKRQPSTDWLEIVREKVQSLRFGTVQIVVHDSKVTQIERTEKTRIESSGTAEAARPMTYHTSDRPDKLEEPPSSRAFDQTTGDRS